MKFVDNQRVLHCLLHARRESGTEEPVFSPIELPAIPLYIVYHFNNLDIRSAMLRAFKR